MEKITEVFLKYAEKIKSQEQYFVSDVKRLEYFQENPQNKTEEDVRQKMSVLNHFQIHDLACQEEMMRHIIELDIDDRLAAHDMQVVNEIAAFHYKGKDHKLLEFASSYCNSHHPNVYPIFSRQHEKIREQYLELNDLLKEGDDLEDYVVFKRVVDDFTLRYDLGGVLNYYESRQLSWLYFDKIIEELSAEN